MEKILIAGDFCPSFKTAELINNNKYLEVFNDLIPLIKATDYNVVNLECPVLIEKVKKIDKTGPYLRCNKNSIVFLKKAGFNLLTLANNHFYDYGDSGVKDTLDTCLSLNVDVVGGGTSLHQAMATFYKDIKGKRFAFINFCETEFSIATSNKGGSNQLNPISNYFQIKEAKSNSDYVIVIVHGGHEMYQLPSPRMKKTYRYFAAVGANAVVNHHTHCYSGYEIYNGTPIVYGLGNFSFDLSKQQEGIWNEGYVVVLLFDDDGIKLETYPYIQDNVVAGIRLMTAKDREKFESKIKYLNAIISDDRLLEQEFQKYNHNEIRNVLSHFEPFSNKYISALYRRRLFPSLLNKRKKLNLLNMIQCESHRDTVIYALKNKISEI